MLYGCIFTVFAIPWRAHVGWFVMNLCHVSCLCHICMLEVPKSTSSRMPFNPRLVLMLKIPLHRTYLAYFHHLCAACRPNNVQILNVSWLMKGLRLNIPVCSLLQKKAECQFCMIIFRLLWLVVYAEVLWCNCSELNGLCCHFIQVDAQGRTLNHFSSRSSLFGPGIPEKGVAVS